MDMRLKYLRNLLVSNEDLISDELDNIEQLILIESYCKGLRKKSTERLAKNLFYSERSILRHRRKALDKLYKSILRSFDNE